MVHQRSKNLGGDFMSSPPVIGIDVFRSAIPIFLQLQIWRMRAPGLCAERGPPNADQSDCATRP